MSLMNKTPLGTLNATRWDRGICVGVYDGSTLLSVEYNEKTKSLDIVINEEAVKKNNVKIRNIASQADFTNGNY